MFAEGLALPEMHRALPTSSKARRMTIMIDTTLFVFSTPFNQSKIPYSFNLNIHNSSCMDHSSSP
jgi:hypothetical protein